MTEHATQVAPSGSARPISVPNLIVSIAFGVLGIFTVVWVTGGDIDLAAIASIAPPYLLTALGLVLLDWALECVRLTLLVRTLGEQVSLRTLIRIITSALFVARITPFNSGGDPFQIYGLSQAGVPLGRATAAVAVKSLLHGSARVGLGLMVPLLLMLTAEEWRPGDQTQIALYAGLGIYLALIATAVGLFLGRASVGGYLDRLSGRPSVSRWLAKPRIAKATASLREQSKVFVDAVGRFGRHSGRRRTLVAVALLSLIGWSSILLVPVVLVRALGSPAPAAAVAVTSIIFYLAVAFGPTPGSAGASEMAFAALYGTFVPSALIGALVLVWRLLTHYLGLVVGFLVMVISLSGQNQDRGKPVRAIDALGGQREVNLVPPEFAGSGTEDVRD